MRRAARLAFNASAALIAGLAAAGCAVNPVTRSPDISLTSRARELELGSREAKKAEAFYGIVDDAALGRYVNAVGRRLVARLPTNDLQYRFTVVDSEVPNAFALPGGYVYVSRGLLAFLNDEDELACVLAHEIAHVAARHSMAQRTRGILTSPLTIATGLAGAATGIVSPRLGDAVAGAGQLASGAVLTSYSREQEYEADRIGMRLAAQAGWDPGGMTAMLVTLQREEALVRGSVRGTGFLDSHPSTPERVAATRSLAPTLVVSATDRISSPRSAFLHRLQDLIVGENPADGIFDGTRFLHPDQRFTIGFPAGWKHYNTRDAVAASAPSQNAAIVLQLLGTGDDPLIAADARKKQIGFSLAGVLRSKINGLDAARVVATARGHGGTTALHLTWIAHRGKIYEITGIAHPSHFERFRLHFIQTADSFAPMTAQQRRSVRVARLTIFAAQGEESLTQVLDRTGSAWSPAVAAAANGLEESARLRDGHLVKAPVRQAY